ncbi:hypothetical protein LYSHEL_15470 [Lysobacter helvus]|uniref:DUF3016 domain-containing protein n=2 Tax=Lysobacteraceae TaxID=32033 RepID=A0ABN6FS84_9GAMM|nr:MULTISPECIES: DUF3016 domain-containing protein [Lysobacter]BCT92523.1 hypothetical protein LYSCAS_15470 [Lysobacter caseinilyticus]BCT95676.1 hypothetical protein LYSHEL_15470 [Lysobacter helvus]
MKRLVAVAFLAAALAGCASTGPALVTDPALPRALPTGSAVAVRWNDPAEFTEIRHSQNRYLAAQGDWVEKLARYVQESTQRALPAGERVDIDILDITRAGQYEWMFSNAQDIRVMRDLYPPRMDVQFKHYDANGTVIAEGERRISDLAYLNGPQPLSSSDPLRYEKRMIDRWVYREFGTRTR